MLCYLWGKNPSQHKVLQGTSRIAALIGFSVSWQFGSCYSWMAKQTDITGRLSPLFQIGCGLSGIAVPPLAGYVFT